MYEKYGLTYPLFLFEQLQLERSIRLPQTTVHLCVVLIFFDHHVSASLDKILGIVRQTLVEAGVPIRGVLEDQLPDPGVCGHDILCEDPVAS